MSGIALTSSSIGMAGLPLHQPPTPGGFALRTPEFAAKNEQRGFHDELRVSAEKLVASAMLMPILDGLSSSPLRPEDGPFAQSVVEERFGPMLHQHLADRMMQSRSFGLVDAVIDRFTRGDVGVVAGARANLLAEGAR
jgi:hypothetical protein